MISHEFKTKVKMHPMRDYKIALAAGLCPTTLSKILNDAMPVEPGDKRVLAIAEVLGFPADQCFDQKQK